MRVFHTLQTQARAESAYEPLESGQIQVEVGDGLDAAEIVFERDVLVGSVSVLVGKAEAEQDAGNFEGVVHLGNKGNGAALADEYGLFAEASLQRRLRFLENGRVKGRGPGLAAAEHFEFAGDRFGQQFADVLFHELGDFLRILVGDQARGKFCVGLRRNHGLGAFAGVAAPNAVELECGARPKLFDDGKTFLAHVTRSSNRSLKIFSLPRQVILCFASATADLGDIVVKAGDGDAKIFVVQLGKKLGQNRERIGNRAAVDPGVQIARGAGQLDLIVVQPAQTVGDGGHALGQHGSVRDDQGIGLELFFVLLHVIPQTDAANFFFTFDEHFYVDGEFAV